MAARKIKIRHDENTRLKIQTSQLINRLMDHVVGKVELSSTQVQAAQILLKKSLPDLQATELSGDPDKPLAITGLEIRIVDPQS